MPTRLDDLRTEVRSFVAEHAPDGLGVLEAHPPHDREPSPVVQEWTARLRAGRWLCPSWPVAYGGRGLSPVEVAVVNEAFATAGAPRVVLGVGERLVAPTILAHGTAAQKARFLPPLLAGDEHWCQGFSEPEAGSDLASLRTRGVIDGDRIVITGQKVWTSEAQWAQWILLLCRTDPDAEQHQGITMVCVPVSQPGVEVRPLRQAHGGAGFNEVFLDGAEARLDHVIGGVGSGWAVANSTLATERGGEATIAHLGYQREWDALVADARAAGQLTDPRIRQRLARAWISTELLRFNGLRQFAALASGEGPGPTGSLHKVLASEHHRAFGELAVDVHGASSMLLPGDADGYEPDRWQRIFFESRSRCISRGTNEIQRNVIAERVLGLPRTR
jgi:alkylation response protein AidB-like acyl-CoA dehydrogenase